MGEEGSVKALEHKIEALGRKIEFEMENDLRGQENGHEFHPATTALIGASLISFGYLWQEGAFIGIFILGAGLSFFDIRKLAGKDTGKAVKLLKNHPAAYIAGGLAASIMFEGAGTPMPGIELGLAASIIQTLLGL